MPEQKISSPEAMQQLAAEVAATLKGGDVLLLTGDLGAGKTTFTQGIAKALGVTEPTTSPTFTIVSEYEVTKHETIKRLVHADLYRLGAPQSTPARRSLGEGRVDLYRLDDDTAAHDPAVRDVLGRVSTPGQLTIIEWSEKLGAAAPADAIRIAFAHGATENERTVTMTNA